MNYAKIGLLYISDICYSSPETEEFSTDSSWIALKSNDEHISKFYQHEGIYDEFLLDELWIYGCDSDLNSCYFSTTPDSVVPHTRGLYVRPVFYTTNNIKIISGNSEINNPFIIE